jgi:hypothetical protein
LAGELVYKEKGKSKKSQDFQNYQPSTINSQLKTRIPKLETRTRITYNQSY